ncbi:hypothetical protein Cni_G07725 [Canna indica]|uniref:RING-type domain-containing protein n=1 Tax=Canna indica TaxID=4628 RepID=A0AAQ3K0T3_9LILI|nr:hypothetical protein Cni_G07725 [Canna indica]
MGTVFETKGTKQGNVHYVDALVPYVVEENFGGYFLDHDDYALAEELQNQESMYLSLQGNVHGNISRGSSSTGTRLNNGYDKSIGERSSSKTAKLESQLALDEAMAREMQELENQLADTSFGEFSRTEATPAQSSTANTDCNSAITSSQVAREDDIDPDNMTYEELQQLGETIGTESRGLSDELIWLLPSLTYKKGLFSKRDKHEECVICRMAYKNRDKLIKLPCQHQYHKDCITRWLKINKACPVCNEEVFG